MLWKKKETFNFKVGFHYFDKKTNKYEYGCSRFHYSFQITKFEDLALRLVMSKYDYKN